MRETVFELCQSPALASFLKDWPAQAKLRHVERSPVPAMRWLFEIHAAAPAFSAPFVTALVAAAASLAWRRSYTPRQVGAAFYDNYAYTEFAGLTGPIPSSQLACGVLVLGPHLLYPPHRHEAEEIYVPLSGTALWQQGNDSWREQPPGAAIHHARHVPHAMKTGREPLLALYFWRSANLAQESQLDQPPGSA